MPNTIKMKIFPRIGLIAPLIYFSACTFNPEIQLQRSHDSDRPSKLESFASNVLLTDAFSDILPAEAGLPKIESKVHAWSELAVKENETGQTKHILTGSTTHLEYFEINGITINNEKLLPAHANTEAEELIIIKQGQLAITIEDKSKTMGPGSVALIMPGDNFELENPRDTPATYYSLKYRSKLPVNLKRGEKAGGSFMVDWNEVDYREHNKGGRRDVFDRPTAMCEDFEMHVTNLNEDIQSHPPHTHVVEEIILMITGNIDIHIDGSEHPATTGDLSFLDSNIPHAPTNTGKGQCIYFAFQWK